MLKKLILVVALMLGGLAVTPGPSQATPLGATAAAQSAAPAQVGKAYYYFYRRRFFRPRYFYRPRFYRPYYRPRFFYRPRRVFRFYY